LLCFISDVTGDRPPYPQLVCILVVNMANAAAKKAAAGKFGFAKATYVGLFA
jgi:hypothetical protein